MPATGIQPAASPGPGNPQDTAPPSPPRRDALIAVSLLLGHVLLTLPWLYRGGAGEPDSVAMISGVYQGLLKGTGFQGNLYMLMGQPLYYGIFFAMPGARQLSWDQLALLMNFVSCLAGAGSTMLVYLVARRFAAPDAAVLGALALLSSPTVFEWSTYGHPVTVSIFLVLVALWLFGRAVSCGGPPGRLESRLPGRDPGMLAAAAVFAGAAMLVRADVIILFHAFPLLGWLHASGSESSRPRIWRFAGIGLLVSAGAAILGFAGLAPFSAGSGTTSASSPAALLQMVKSYFHLMPLRDGVLELAFGMGVFGALLGGLAGAMAFVRRRWSTLLVSAALIAPPLIFAMGNPQPARRFLHAVYAAFFALALLWQAAPPRLRRFGPMLAGAAIAGNLLLLPLLGDLLRSRGYPVGEHSLLFRATADVIDHHRASQRHLAWVEARMKEIRRTAPEDTLLLGAFAHVNFLLASFSRDGKPAEAAVVQSAPGMFVTAVRSEGLRLDVCEYHSAGTSVTLARSYSRVHAFTSADPADLGSSAPVERHLPPRDSMYQMWFRPVGAWNH